VDTQHSFHLDLLSNLRSNTWKKHSLHYMPILCSVHKKHTDFILFALIWSEAEVTLASVKSLKCHYVYNNVRTSRQDHNYVTFEVLMIETIKSAVLENRTWRSPVASCQWSQKSVKSTLRVDRWRNLIIIWLVLKCAYWPLWLVEVGQVLQSSQYLMEHPGHLGQDLHLPQPLTLHGQPACVDVELCDELVPAK